MVSLRVTVAVCLLCVCVHGEEEQVENKLDSIQEKLNELSRDDPRGIFPEINLNVKGDNKKTKYRYREGDKVINLKEITFKRAKGKKGDTLPPFTLMTITQVPGMEKFFSFFLFLSQSYFYAPLFLSLIFFFFFFLDNFFFFLRRSRYIPSGEDGPLPWMVLTHAHINWCG